VVNPHLISLQGSAEYVVQMQLTEDFFCPKESPDCAIDVSVLIPNSVDSCELSSVAVTQSKIPCGMRFKKSDFKNGNVMNVTLKNIGGDRFGNINNQFYLMMKTGIVSYDAMFSDNVLPHIKVVFIFTLQLHIDMAFYLKQIGKHASIN